MNVLFLSPFFPPNAQHYCRALAQRGASVLAVGDEPAIRQPSALAGALTEYVFAPHMAEYPALRAAVAGLVERHGDLHRLDSNGEHWLEAEGRLRDDFRVSGLSLADTRLLRSKQGMAAAFSRAGVAYPLTVSGSDAAQLRELVRQRGFPLVFKPDSGSGAVDTFLVKDQDELTAALARELSGHVAQPFVTGDIVTFDGLTDSDGRIVFHTSHVYDTGIMQVRQGELDGHYYSLRELPPELEKVGRRTVEAFGIRERFFHVEFFAQPDGSYVGLEMNIRPPGGFSPEMMNAACEVDVFDLWASVVAGASLADFTYKRLYHTAHAGRRASQKYRLSRQELERELAGTLFAVLDVPDAFATTMGNVAYLLRHEDLPALKHAVALVQARADG